MAEFFDVSIAYFDRDIRPLVQPKHVRRVNRRLFFYGRGVIEAWAAQNKIMPSFDSSELGYLPLEFVELIER